MLIILIVLQKSFLMKFSFLTQVVKYRIMGLRIKMQLHFRSQDAG